MAIDLFSGAGGLALGLEQAGFDVAAAVEYDPVHAAVHAFNFPLTRVLCADVCTLDAATLREAVEEGVAASRGQPDWDGEIDLIAGGPPCQGFSTMGKRLIDDPRNELVFHFYRLIVDLRPRYFVMENVPGMRSGGHAGILERLIREFREGGYSIDGHKILNSADFGVPQDRKRLFLVGSRQDVGPADYPAATVRPRDKRGAKVSDGVLPLGPTVWDALADLPDLDQFRELARTDIVRLSEEELERRLTGASVYARCLRGDASDPDDLSIPRAFDPALLTSSRQTKHTPLSIKRFRATKQGETEPVSRFYRLHADGLSNTLRAGTGRERGAYTSPRPIHPTIPRVISVREAARLHSMPDWFRLHATKWHGFRQIGNAVPPLVGRAVGQEIVGALGLSPAKPRGSLNLGDEKLLRMSMDEASRHFSVDVSTSIKPRQRREQVAKAA